jgi:hypothetical protein
VERREATVEGNMQTMAGEGRTGNNPDSIVHNNIIFINLLE